MNKKILAALALSLLCISSFASCEGGNKKIADNSTQEEYYTQTSLSAQEYKMYLTNKISVATNQINTHMTKIQNVANGSCSYEDEIEALASSIEILKEDKKDMTYVYPPDSYSSTRENALTYWQDAVDKMQEMSEYLEGKNISLEKAIEFATGLKDTYTSIHSLSATV